MAIYLKRGADSHMAQLMPLPLTISCFSKIQIGFTTLVPAHLGNPGQRYRLIWVVLDKGLLNECVCVLCPRHSGALSDTAIHPSICLSHDAAALGM